MGQSQSKPTGPKIKSIGNEQSDFDLLDLIATNFIVTQNFKDMKNLIKPDYCNKLIILTTDVIQNYLKGTTIEYLAKNEGGVDNKLKKESIIYIQSKAQEDTLSKNRRGGGPMFDEYDDDDYLGYLGPNYKRKSKKDSSNNKLTLTYLDVKPSEKKQRMCIGIAKFYVTIGHLWSAILLSVNPQYKYKDDTGRDKFISFEDRDKLKRDNIIEKNTKVTLTDEDSLCIKRINALNNKKIGDGVINESIEAGVINIKSVCGINKKNTLKTNREGYAPSEWGKKETTAKNLTNEIGIPELEQLYNDYYNYETGTFSHRIPGGKTDQQYKKDLELLYSSFTGNIDYEEWNKDGTKTFKDITLSQFDNACSVKRDKDGNDIMPIFKMNFERIDDNREDVLLFKKYANHIKMTKKKIISDRKNILAVLQDIFVIKVLQDGKEIVTINPKLHNKRLDDIVASVREKIINLYVTCEKNFKTALEIVNNIASMRKQEIIEEQKRIVEKEIDETIVGNDDANQQTLGRRLDDAKNTRGERDNPRVDRRDSDNPRVDRRDSDNPRVDRRDSDNPRVDRRDYDRYLARERLERRLDGRLDRRLERRLGRRLDDY